MKLGMRYVGGPTALVEMGRVRLLTEPTFDPPGTYPVGTRLLTKTVGPAFGVEEIGHIDSAAKNGSLSTSAGDGQSNCLLKTVQHWPRLS